MGPLVRLRTFPDAQMIFEFTPETAAVAFKDGLVVMDTNALLVPYNIGKASLKEIRSTLEKLSIEGRLRIPGQVAREFAGNRAEKLKLLFQQVSRKRDVALNQGSYPLLEGDPKYSELQRKELELAEALKGYRKLIGEMLETIAGWHWDDPVSTMYREFFKPPVVCDPEFDKTELLKELEYRYENKVPPGYKDASNEHSGLGDFIIWKTLLSLGEKEQKHLVFVTGEEKSDWWYRSENRALYPRFELLDEYRRASGGKSLVIVGLSDLLRQFGASDTVVEEVAVESDRLDDWDLEWHMQGHTEARPWDSRALQAVFRYLRRQHPVDKIWGAREGSVEPDLIVRSPSGLISYDVRTIDSSQDVAIQVERVIREYDALNSPRADRTRMNLVFVAHSLAEAAQVQVELLVLLPGSLRYSILIGHIDRSGTLEVHYGFEPPSTTAQLNAQ